MRDRERARIFAEEKRNVKCSRNALDKLKGPEKVLEVSRSMGAFKFMTEAIVWTDFPLSRACV